MSHGVHMLSVPAVFSSCSSLPGRLNTDCSSPAFMEELFHFNDVFFCILCEKRAAVSQRLGVCFVAWVWLWGSLRCSCIQEAGGRPARVEYNQHAALRWFVFFSLFNASVNGN